jgi:hypothetical protein
LKENDLIGERLKRRVEMEILNITRDLITRDVEEMKKSEVYNRILLRKKQTRTLQ